MAKNINKELYIQASKNIADLKKSKLKKEIQKEYQTLLFESQKRKASKKTMEKIKQYYELAKNKKISSTAHCYVINRIRANLKETIKTGLYHPKDIKGFGEWVG